ncbi:hypothetical protein QR680_015655 [Steinernema hermaphroditum]|uniref:WAP domain-containing protein n=1 Tax=Steinernema hermaphroditum TaxID=289476 RepID=A0AA39H8J7_9BILA|nr:hypothetical protein QR680_015655 [Steinernema hermaphroditum]
MWTKLCLLFLVVGIGLADVNIDEALKVQAELDKKDIAPILREIGIIIPPISCKDVDCAKGFKCILGQCVCLKCCRRCCCNDDDDDDHHGKD